MASNFDLSLRILQKVIQNSNDTTDPVLYEICRKAQAGQHVAKSEIAT